MGLGFLGLTSLGCFAGCLGAERLVFKYSLLAWLVAELVALRAQPDAEVVLLARLLGLPAAHDLALVVLDEVVSREPAGRLLELPAPHA